MTAADLVELRDLLFGGSEPARQASADADIEWVVAVHLEGKAHPPPALVRARGYKAAEQAVATALGLPATACYAVPATASACADAVPLEAHSMLLPNRADGALRTTDRLPVAPVPSASVAVSSAHDVPHGANVEGPGAALAADLAGHTARLLAAGDLEGARSAHEALGRLLTTKPSPPNARAPRAGAHRPPTRRRRLAG
jgi:hypothetical protein